MPPLLCNLGLDYQDGTNLMFWDRQTDDTMQLAAHNQGPEGVSISETHAAWVAYGGPDKDVYYMDTWTWTWPPGR